MSPEREWLEAAQILQLELYAPIHVCAPGLDPYVEPRCPHPHHDGHPKSRALRSHPWHSYVAHRTGGLRFMGCQCDACGQDFSRVYFYELPAMWCPARPF